VTALPGGGGERGTQLLGVDAGLWLRGGSGQELLLPMPRG